MKKSLRRVLSELAAEHPEGVLVSGYKTTAPDKFTKLVQLANCAERFMQCSKVVIRPLSFYPQVEQDVCTFVRPHFARTPLFDVGLMSNRQRLLYAIGGELYTIMLCYADRFYHIIVQRNLINTYRYER